MSSSSASVIPPRGAPWRELPNWYVTNGQKVVGPVDTVPDALADPGRLEEIIRRLLANAIKFTPDGGVVELRAAERDGAVGISVTDTGIGVAPDQQPHVFEAFHQGERPLPDHAQGGAGLGLAVVKGLVLLHGGTASISSVPDQGSTLTITVPAAARPAVVPSMAEPG